MDLILYFTFNFFLYGFIGWIIENLYSYYKTGAMQKDGFLYSPFKPMYAIAMVVLIVCSRVNTIDNYILVTLCFMIPTFVEFITGSLMREYFKKDYWDYSNLKYNYKGIICLSFSIYWTILTFIGVKYFQVYIVDKMYMTIIPYWSELWFLFLIALILDNLKTIRTLKTNKNVIN